MRSSHSTMRQSSIKGSESRSHEEEYENRVHLAGVRVPWCSWSHRTGEGMCAERISDSLWRGAEPGWSSKGVNTGKPMQQRAKILPSEKEQRWVIMSNTMKYGKDDLHPKKADVWKYMKYSYKTHFYIPASWLFLPQLTALLNSFWADYVSSSLSWHGSRVYHILQGPCHWRSPN